MKRLKTSMGLAALAALGLWGGSLAHAVQQDAPPPNGQDAPPPAGESAPPPGAAGEVGTPPGGEADLPEEYDALARGPLHEAFANPYATNPAPGEIIREQPPEPIEELPPEEVPEGDGIVWIPGYWGWEPSEEQFIWISGLWREVPADHRWVPGYWTEAEGGFQWIAGFWSESSTEQIAYLPEPPASQERGPNVAPPSQDSIWIPGSWIWEQRDYQWRPGYWGPAVPGWVWIPDQYVWTPHGCIFVAGYWDRTFEQRGVIFAPIVYHEPIYTQPDYYYTPRFVVNTAPLLMHLFASPGHSHYYYGDYYGYRGGGSGFFPWYGYSRRAQLYDPLFTYYSWSYARRDVNLARRLSSWNNYFVGNERYRPPHTFRAQQEFIAGINVDNAPVQVSSVVLTNTFQNAIRSENNNYNFTQLAEDRRNVYRESSRGLRQFQQERRDFERAVAQGENAADRTAQQAGAAAAGLRLPENPIAQAGPDRPADSRENVPDGQQPGPEDSQQPGAPDAPDRPDAGDRQGDRPGARRGGPPARPEPIQRDPNDQSGQAPDEESGDRTETPGTDRPDTPGAPGADRPDQPGQGDQPGQPDRPDQPRQPGAGEPGEDQGPRFPRFGVGPREGGSADRPRAGRPGDPGQRGLGQPGEGAPGAGRPGGNDPLDRLPPGVNGADVPGAGSPRGGQRPGQPGAAQRGPGRDPGAPGAGGAAPRAGRPGGAAPGAESPDRPRPGNPGPNVQPPSRGPGNAGPAPGAGRPNRPAGEARRPQAPNNPPAPNPGAAGGPGRGSGKPPAAAGGGGKGEKGKPDKK